MAAARGGGDFDFPPLEKIKVEAVSNVPEANAENVRPGREMVHVVKKVPPRAADDSDEEGSDSSSPNEMWDTGRMDLGQASGGSELDSVVQDSRIRRDPSVTVDQESAERNMPKTNCPERIVICIDISSEMEDLPFTFSDGSKHSPLFMVKRVVELFVHNKHKIDKRHEFALVVFHEVPLWIKNFTSDPKDISNFLDDLNETRLCESCDLSGLFNGIMEQTHIPEIGRDVEAAPPFLVRVVLIYGRSGSVPLMHRNVDVLKQMMQSLYFFLDILYIHRPLSEDNCCQEVFDSFVALDEHLASYVFEVSRNATKLHNCMAKLLSHPLQRPHQHLAHYKIKADDSPS
ncbi:BRISC and BRCA1-A complex member 1 [Ixodes scapularis]|nr:BRISC and BRCA1-A complex member 1 [Ixodes scapularis]